MSKGWSCRTYYNVNPFVGLCVHDTMGVIPAPPFFGPMKLPHLDFSVVQGLWLGSYLSKRNHRSVVSEGLLFVGRMSDAGFIVPHISYPPSWYNLLTTLFGSSNCLFGSSSVSVACRNLLWGNEDCDLAATPFGPVPFSLNLSCWDPISLPTDLVVVWGSVYVGMTWDDIAAAAIDFAINVAAEVAGAVAGDLASRGWKKAKGAYRKVMKIGAEGMSSTTRNFVKQVDYVKGVKMALDMTDDDLARYVSKKSGSEGIEKSYSSALKKVTGNLDDAMQDMSTKYAKNIWSTAVDGQARAGFDAADDVLKEALLAGLTSSAAKDAAITNVLEVALRNLDDSLGPLVTTWAVWEIGMKMAKKTGTKAVWSHLVSQGNIFGEGTEGGVLSFEGLGWTNLFQSSRRWQDKYGMLDFVADPDEEWDIAYAELNDDDYWFGDDWSVQDDEAVTGDDDYWYDEDSQVEPAAGSSTTTSLTPVTSAAATVTT
jgi:hypothetical protein